MPHDSSAACSYDIFILHRMKFMGVSLSLCKLQAWSAFRGSKAARQWCLRHPHSSRRMFLSSLPSSCVPHDIRGDGRIDGHDQHVGRRTVGCCPGGKGARWISRREASRGTGDRSGGVFTWVLHRLPAHLGLPAPQDRLPGCWPRGYRPWRHRNHRYRPDRVRGRRDPPRQLDTAALLQATGFRVVVSRTTNASVVRLSPQDVANGELTVQGAHDDVAARDLCANLAQADVLVGIYFDAGASAQAAGSLTGYDTARPFAADNLRLATLVQLGVLGEMNAQGWDIPNDGVVSDTSLGGPPLSEAAAAYGHLLLLGPADPGYFSTPSEMPGALVEPLFVTDPYEAMIALQPEWSAGHCPGNSRRCRGLLQVDHDHDHGAGSNLEERAKKSTFGISGSRISGAHRIN